MRDGQPFSFNNVYTIWKDGKQKIGYALIEKVDLIDIKDASVCFCQ